MTFIINVDIPIFTHKNVSFQKILSFMWNLIDALFDNNFADEFILFHWHAHIEREQVFLCMIPLTAI